MLIHTELTLRTELPHSEGRSYTFLSVSPQKGSHRVGLRHQEAEWEGWDPPTFLLAAEPGCFQVPFPPHGDFQTPPSQPPRLTAHDLGDWAWSQEVGTRRRQAPQVAG